MSFQKRKTSYRKGVTSAVLDEYPIPEEGEFIARIIGSRGGNMFEIELANGTKSLAILPTKFNKLIWMKRGDYVIVSGSEGQFTTASGKQNGVEAMIQHILMKDQINHIKKEGLWPEVWSETKSKPEEPEEDTVENPSEDAAEDVSEDGDSDFDLGRNPNRRRFYVESDSDSSV
ncbi:hypothetical protein WA171_005984 [Blastocystis sp. BT1]